MKREFKYRSNNDFVINKSNVKIYDPKSLKEINSINIKGVEKGATSNLISFYKYEGGKELYAEIRDLRSKGKRYSYFYDSFMVKLDDLTEITTGMYENINVKYYSLKPGDKLIGEVNPFKDSVLVKILYMNKLITPGINVSKTDVKLIQSKIDDKYEKIHIDNFNKLYTEYLYVVLCVFFIFSLPFGILWGIFQKQTIKVVNNIVFINGMNKATVNIQNGMDGRSYIDIVINNTKRLQYKFPFENGKLKILRKDLKALLKLILRRKNLVAFWVILFVPFLLYTHIFYLKQLPLLLFMKVSYIEIITNLEVLIVLISGSFILFYFMKFIAQKIIILKYTGKFRALLNNHLKANADSLNK